MKLDVEILVDKIKEMPDKQKYDRSIFRNIMGIISGNQMFFKKASLNDLIYYMENLDEILQNEFEEEYPKIDLQSISGSRHFKRRAI